MFELIDYQINGPVATIWHNRPASRNAESQQLLDEMDNALGVATADPDIKVIVIAGRGDHFSAGHDVKEAQAKRSNFTVEERYAYEELRYFRYALNIYDCPKPTIAMVQGACIAGAFMVANMCDLIVASDDAYFSDPVARTMGAAAVEVLIHPWVLGQRKAREMLYTGERFTAQDAKEIGMLNRVVPREQLETATMELALKIAEGPSFTLKILKRSLNRVADMQGFRASLEAHFDTHQLSHMSEAFRDAYQAGLSTTIAKGKAS